MDKIRYVIGFGYERDRDAALTGRSEPEVISIVERSASEVGLPAYALRFGPGSWLNPDTDERIQEQGGTVEYVGTAPDEAMVRYFAIRLRHELQQGCVVFYTQRVETFKFI